MTSNFHADVLRRDEQEEDERSMSTDDEEYNPGDAAEEEQLRGSAGERKKHLDATKKRKRKAVKELKLEDGDSDDGSDTSDIRSTKRKLEEPISKEGQTPVFNSLSPARVHKKEDITLENKAEVPKPKSVDDLWAEMNRPIVKKQARSDQMDFIQDWISTPSVRSSTNSLLPQQGRTVHPSSLGADSVEHEPLPPTSNGIPLTEQSSTPAQATPSDRIPLENRLQEPSGLDSIVSGLKTKRQSVMARSRHHWEEFKKEQDIEDEMAAHKKDKTRFTERVAFLDRVDLREWEAEQSEKSKRR